MRFSASCGISSFFTAGIAPAHSSRLTAAAVVRVDDIGDFDSTLAGAPAPWRWKFAKSDSRASARASIAFRSHGIRMRPGQRAREFDRIARLVFVSRRCERGVFQLPIRARGPQQKTAAAHVAETGEHRRENETLAENRPEDVDVLPAGDAA